MHIKQRLKILISLLILLGTFSSYAFDYKGCLFVDSDSPDSAMVNIIQQVASLSKVGRNEEVNFRALAYNYGIVVANFDGFSTARTILFFAKYPSKEDEVNPKAAFQLMANAYIKSIEHLNDSINEDVAFVKNQSVRDDLKALVIKNQNQLRRLSPCAN